ncbi:MAG: HNH endonuclease [Chloroflexota bacterium]|nr:HNH endonuclease [Chloroflexota bacterium]
MPEQRISAELRQHVTERANGSCEYCRSQARYATQPFSVEHMTPRAKGGSTTLENLALACQGCNNHKYDEVEALDPVSGERVPLYHPRHDGWNTHFTWSDDFTLIIGLTPTGRATIATLFLNRDGVVHLRWLLYTIGEHPPPIIAINHTRED